MMWRPFGFVPALVLALPMALACSSAPASPSGGDSNDVKEAPKNSSSSTPAASSAATPAPSATTTAPAATAAGTGVSVGLPCDVSAVLAKNCQGCHGGAGAPRGLKLVTWDDLQVPVAGGLKAFQDVETMIHAPVGQMPPTGRLADADMKVLDDWITAGATRSDVACTGAPATTTPTPVATEPSGNPCTSNVQCVLGQVCRGGTCTPGCFSNEDCPSTTMCMGGQCTAGGGTQPTFPGGPQAAACSTNAQCPANSLCFQGQCVALQSSPNGGFCFGNGCF